MQLRIIAIGGEIADAESLGISVMHPRYMLKVFQFAHHGIGLNKAIRPQHFDRLSGGIGAWEDVRDQIGPLRRHERHPSVNELRIEERTVAADADEGVKGMPFQKGNESPGDVGFIAAITRDPLHGAEVGDRIVVREVRRRHDDRQRSPPQTFDDVEKHRLAEQGPQHFAGQASRAHACLHDDADVHDRIPVQG